MDRPLPEVLSVLCLMVEEQQPQVLASVLLLDASGQHLITGAAPNLPASYNQAIDGAAIGPHSGSCGTAAFRRQLVIVEDIESDPLWDNYRDLARPHGLRACAAHARRLRWRCARCPSCLASCCRCCSSDCRGSGLPRGLS